MLISTMLMGLAQVSLLAVNGVAIVAVVLRLWKKREPRPLARLVGRALAAAWLVSIVALVIDIVMLVQEALVHVNPADKATIVSAGVAEALNCLALFLVVTLLPLAVYVYLRVSAARAEGEVRLGRKQMMVALFVWAAGVALHAWLYAEHYSRAAREARIEEYAYTRSFQLIAFAYARLPFWIGGLLMAWLLSSMVMRRKTDSGR